MEVFVLRTVSVVTLALALCASAQEPPTASMQKDFQSPPEAAKPRVWWHWMSDNVSKEGTTADLEWMHRVGIGGTHPMGPVVGRDGKETQGEYDAFYAGVRK